MVFFFFQTCGLVTGISLNDTVFLTAFGSSTVDRNQSAFPAATEQSEDQEVG